MQHLSVALCALMLAVSTSYGFSLGGEIGSCFSGGCDVIWSINRNIDDGIRSKSESLVGPAKQAFLEVIQVLFDQKLVPLLDYVDEVAKSRLNQVQSIVNQTSSQIEELIDTAAKAAQAVTSDSVKAIKKEIIDATFDRADKLVKDVSKQLRLIIDDVDCKIGGKGDAVIVWARNILKFPNPFSACNRQHGFIFSLPESDDYINIYRITKCKYKTDLEKSRTVYDVKFNYARLSLLSRRFACIVGDSARTPIDQDARRFSDMFNVWDLASGRR